MEGWKQIRLLVRNGSTWIRQMVQGRLQEKFMRKLAKNLKEAGEQEVGKLKGFMEALKAEGSPQDQARLAEIKARMEHLLKKKRGSIGPLWAPENVPSAAESSWKSLQVNNQGQILHFLAQNSDSKATEPLDGRNDIEIKSDIKSDIKSEIESEIESGRRGGLTRAEEEELKRLGKEKAQPSHKKRRN